MLPCFLTMALVAVFGAGSRGSSPASGVRPPAGDAAFQQDAVSRAERLVQEAKQDGSRYLQSKDESAKKSAKRSLEEAEDLLKKELKRDARCERCVAALTSDYFYRAAFGISKNFDDCIKTATEALSRFPTNGVIAFYKGYAHYNSKQYADAIKALNLYFASKPSDDQAAAQARQVLADSQRRFLAEWNHHANFYQTPESRIEVFNAQTYKQDVVFQVTPEYELGLGNQAVAQVAQSGKQVKDPQIQSYLEGLVSRLTSQSPGPSFNYQVVLLDSPEVNAFTVPGRIFVNTGLLAACESEAELAAVLGHELAHNYAHHGARMLIQQYHAQALAANLARAVNPQGQVAQLMTQLATSLGVGLFTKAYSRAEEKEADLYGTHIMFNAGYNPTAMSSFDLKLFKLHPKEGIKLFNTHPPAPDRVQYVTEYLESFPLDREMRTDSEDFQRIRARFVGAQKPGVVIPPG
jgi:predicted Zn-dependent protease